jgi:hypothetical protein
VGRESHVITVGVSGTRHAHNGTDCPILRHGVLHQVLRYQQACRVQWTVTKCGKHGPPQNQTDSRGISVILAITWCSGLNRRMQVWYLARAEIFLFSTSYLVTRVKQKGTWTLTTQPNLITRWGRREALLPLFLTPSEREATFNTDTVFYIFLGENQN